ncbi:hypothetical protein V2J09_012408 [Rumex salicifolius]
MEDFQSKFRQATESTKIFASSIMSDARVSLSEAAAAASPPPVTSTDILIAIPPRQGVSLWTCSKLCAFSFAVGIIVGYTLKRRVRKWASKVLKRLKDD